MRRLLFVLLAGTSCTGVLKMGLHLKLDIFGAKASFKLPLEFYPVTDGGYPPEGLVCE